MKIVVLIALVDVSACTCLDATLQPLELFIFLQSWLLNCNTGFCCLLAFEFQIFLMVFFIRLKRSFEVHEMTAVHMQKGRIKDDQTVLKQWSRRFQNGLLSSFGRYIVSWNRCPMCAEPITNCTPFQTGGTVDTSQYPKSTV